MSAMADDDLAPVAGRGAGDQIVATLIAGPVLYGGIGYLIQRFLEVQHAFWIGILIGLALSVFMLIKRFGGTEK